MINLNNVSLLDLLPESIRDDENVKAAALAVDSKLAEIRSRTNEISFFRRLYDGTITEQEADERAAMYHVDFYDVTLPLTQKIELIKNSFIFHRTKGTPGAVEDLIKILFGDGEVEEWWQYGGEPGHFQVVTTNPQVTTERTNEFLRAVNSIKRLSAWLDQVLIRMHATETMYFGNAVHVGDYIQIK